jgi:nitrite reductase/ring-hydroxylating ferredoxin subunit
MSPPLRDRQVISLDALRGLTRRQFCHGALAGSALAVLPGCTSSPSWPVGTGGFSDDGGGGGDNPDLAGGGPPPRPDLARPGSAPDLRAPPQDQCAPGIYDTGQAPSSFASGTATYFIDQSAFVCRDGGGLYALSSICTHAGCNVAFGGSAFHCPCHGATFDFNGGERSGPTNGPLDHYAVCITGGGTVGFDTNTVVAAATRYPF